MLVGYVVFSSFVVVMPQPKHRQHLKATVVPAGTSYTPYH